MVISILLTILFSSCARTLSVSRSGKVKGIPFYTQKAIILQETKYLYDWKVLTLIKKVGEEKVKVTPIVQVRIKSDEDLTALEAAVNALNKEGATENDLQGVTDEIKQLKQVSLHSDDIDSDNIIGNKWSSKMIVDYSRTFYLNSKLPWFGTSTVSQKLASNGTLSEASGTIDSQIDELAGVVAGLATPLASVKVAEIENEVTPSVVEEISTIEAFGNFDRKSLELENDFLMAMISNLSKEIVRYELKVEEKGYIYTFSKTYEFHDSDKANTPISFDLGNGNYTRENWPQNKKEPKKEDKPTINVSGSIQLPEEKKG